MANNDLQQYTDFVIEFLKPLVKATESSDQARALIMELGYDTPGNVSAFDELAQMVKDLFDVINTIDQLSESNSNDSTKIAQAVMQLFAKVGSSAIHISKFSTQLQQNFSGQNILVQTDILQQLPVKLIDLLIIVYLKNNLPKVHALLTFAGYIDETYIEEVAPLMPAYTKRVVNWQKIPQLFTDPITQVKEIFIENDSIKFNNVIFLLQNVGLALGVLPDINVPDVQKLNSFNNGPALSNSPLLDDMRYLHFPLIGDPMAALALEVYPVMNLGTQKYDAVGVGLNFGSQLEIPIGDRFKLKIEFSASLADSLGLKISKNGQFEFLSAIFSNPASIGAGIRINFKATFETVESPLTEKFLSIGSTGGSRFEIESGSFTFGIEKRETDANIFVELDLKGGQVVINLGGADSFIGSMMSQSNITSNFDLGLGFSNKGGLYIKGGSLEIAMPTHIQLGPLEIVSLLLGLKIQQQNFTAMLAAGFNAKLGPLAVVVENIGLKADIQIRPDKDGNFGILDVKPGFKPPNGLGLSINAGVVSGGGYLYFDFDKEEYAGVMELNIANFISAKAIGLITTRMPDGSKGFSMLIIITAEFNPAFQLGYGFTLIGVGGLLGLNRTVLLDPLREGVRTGAVNNIMFPQNVVANAPRIISDLKTIFPPYQGKFLIGPMAKLGWGTPTLISLSFGLIIEIPGNIAILGVLRVILPDKDAAVVTLQVAFVGTLDFDKKMLTFDASLYESSILWMTLEGDMAVRLKWGDDPNFILTIGGFHPSYTPPPLSLPTLRRLAISILDNDIAKIRVECYQAVTSNTVQFGARADIKFDLRVCTISGFISFDALFQFSPFYFIIQVAAGFNLKVAGLDLLTVRVKMSLEGPTPWRAKGTGSISLLFFEISADFDKTWGEEKNTTLPSVSIFQNLIAELNKQSQWTTVLDNGKVQMVSLRKFTEEDTPPLILHPAGALVIRQKLVPLTILFDKVGNQATNDVKRIDIKQASSNGDTLKTDPVQEDFARAQFQKMSDAEKLSKPSFEKMPGGVQVSMGNSTVKNGKMVRRKVQYEMIIIDKEPIKPLKFGLLFKQIGILFKHGLKSHSASRSALSQSNLQKKQPFEEKVQVSQEGYTVAFTANNKAFSNSATFGSEMNARTFMQEQLRQQPGLKNSIHIIPNYELQTS